MAPIDPRTVNPLGAREDAMAKGKDVLVGWLVGKAGVDFGVAQVLAASEAQAAAQLNRLEETLLARINALQQERKPDGEIAASYRDALSALEAELKGFASRLMILESAGRHAEQIGATLGADIAALKAALIEQQGGLQPADLAIRRFEETLDARVRELQDQVVGSQDRFDARETQLKVALRTEIIAIQRQLDERQNRLESRHSTIETLLENVAVNFRSLEGWLSDKLRVIELGSGELEQLKAEMHAAAQRMAELELVTPRAPTLAPSDAPAAEQLKRLEETLSARVGELQAAQKIGAEVLEARARELGDLRGELQGFAERIVKLESTGQHSAQESDTLHSEITALKREVAEQRDRQPAEPVIRAVEAAFSARIHEVHGRIDKEQERWQARESQFGGIETELQKLGGRLAESEAAAEQLGRWVRSETESARSLNEGLKTELISLRDLLHEQRGQDLDFEKTEAALREKIDEVKNQVGQQLSALEGREGELAEWIKRLDQGFGNRMAELENQLSEKFGGLDASREESRQFRSELSALADRIARQEFEAQQGRASTTDETQRTEQLASRLTVEMTGLHADLNAQRQSMQLVESLVKGIEGSLYSKIDLIEKHLAKEEARGDDRDVEFTKLQSEVRALVEQQERTALGAEQVRAWAAAEAKSAAKLKESLEMGLGLLRARLDERQATEAAFGAKIEELQSQLGEKLNPSDRRASDGAEWIRAVEESLSTKMQALEERLGEKFGGLGNGNGALEQLASELRAVQQRMVAMEAATLRMQTIVASEVPAAEPMKRLEEALLVKINEFQKGLQSAGEALVGRERELSQLRTAIQDVSTRIGNIEIATQQTGQLGNALRGEIDALKTDLCEQQQRLGPMDSALRKIDAAWRAKIAELQAHLVSKQGSGGSGRRLEEFSGTTPDGTERSAGISFAAPQIPPALTGTEQAVIKDAIGGGTAVRQVGGQGAGQPADRLTTRTGASPGQLEQQSRARDAEKEQLNQLQQRMAAEIERVRAELKERSGRWKVRKGGVAF